MPEANANMTAEPDFARAHAELLSNRMIQFDLPPAQQPEIPEWLRWLGQKLAVLGPYLPAIFWILVGISAVIILLLIIDAFWPGRLSLPRWMRRRRAAEGEQLVQPSADITRQLLAEADALASDGRYDEAAHRLLARTIEEMDGRLPGEVRPTLTSRELADSALLPPRPAGYLREIVAMVERALFARRPLSEADWLGCRAAYKRFASADSWRRAARP